MPLLIRGPGILPARRSGELVANVDLAPTILQFTERRPRRRSTAARWCASSQDPAKRTQRPILLEGFTGIGERGRCAVRANASINASPRDYEGLRIGRYKFIQYRSGAKSSTT